MSRSNYSEDCANLELWRANVERTINSKRGQVLLKELEAALVALPDKALVANDMAIPEEDSVCALGAVALKRGIEKGKDRLTVLREIAEKFPQGCDAGQLADEFDISSMLAREITYVNDEQGGGYRRTPQKRYEEVLRWVREQIVKV